MKHAPPAPPELGTRRRPLLRAVPAGRRARSRGRRDPARRRLGEGEPLRLRARLPRRRGWPRSRSTRAGTAARTAPSGRARSTTCWRWRSCCAQHAPRVACAARAWAAFRRSTRRRATPRSAPSWRSARRRRTACCAACAPGESAALRLRRCRQPRSGSSRSTCIDAAGRLGPDTALLLLHARGDEQIPYTVSEELYAAAHEPKRLLVLPGGHHRSLQHDLEVQAMSRRFIRKATRSG